MHAYTSYIDSLAGQGLDYLCNLSKTFSNRILDIVGRCAKDDTRVTTTTWFGNQR